MNRLATLLGMSEVEVKHLVGSLEARSGYESVDVRFLAGHQQEVRGKLNELGLDPDDTTGEELYHALLAKFGRDSQLVEKSLGIGGEATASVRQQKSLDLLKLLLKDVDVWALKSTPLKTLLRQNPPKKIMKLLGYRSVESMVKHEDSGKIILAARSHESPTWRKKMGNYVAKLSSSGYEMKRLKLLNLSAEVNLLGGNVASFEALSGCLAIGSQPGAEASVLTLLLAAIAELERGGALRESSSMLSALNPALAWWAGLEHMAALKDGAAVSFNVRDVAHNYSRKLDYSKQISGHAANSILSRLTKAYEAKIQTLSDNTKALEVEAAQAFKGTSAPMRELAAEVVEV